MCLSVSNLEKHFSRQGTSPQYLVPSELSLLKDFAPEGGCRSRLTICQLSQLFSNSEALINIDNQLSADVNTMFGALHTLDWRQASVLFITKLSNARLWLKGSLQEYQQVYQLIEIICYIRRDLDLHCIEWSWLNILNIHNHDRNYDHNHCSVLLHCSIIGMERINHYLSIHEVDVCHK